MKKKMTAHSLTIKHKIAKKSSSFTKNRKEEEMEQEGKKKHMKRKSAGMKCKVCGSTAHAMHPKTETKKHTKKKAALQTNAARFEKMRKKVFGLK